MNCSDMPLMPFNTFNERWKEANEKSYYGMKATLSDGIVTFEDGQKFDLSQPIKEANEVKDG